MARKSKPGEREKKGELREMVIALNLVRIPTLASTEATGCGGGRKAYCSLAHADIIYIHPHNAFCRNEKLE